MIRRNPLLDDRENALDAAIRSTAALDPSKQAGALLAVFASCGADVDRFVALLVGELILTRMGLSEVPCTRAVPS